MRFEVKDKNLILNESTLLELIFKSVLDVEKQSKLAGNKELVAALAKQLVESKALLGYKLLDLLLLAFDVGYYYGKFISKYDVEIGEDK